MREAVDDNYVQSWITMEQFVQSASEGDSISVALALLQADPVLDPNQATEHGDTPTFAAFKMVTILIPNFL